MVELISTPRSKGGWTKEENEILFREAQIANDEGRSVKSVFDKLSTLTGRKPNSIRNYYYLQLKERGEATKTCFIPFSDDEVVSLLRDMLTGQAQGKSVRGIALELASGDKKAMLRYQNKYRSLIKFSPDLVKSTIDSLAEQGIECTNPYTKKECATADIAETISELVDNLNRAGINPQSLLMELNDLAHAAAKSDERVTHELGKQMLRNSDMECRLNKLLALNKGFLQLSGIERIAGLNEYVEALRQAVTL